MSRARGSCLVAIKMLAYNDNAIDNNIKQIAITVEAVLFNANFRLIALWEESGKSAN